MSVRFKRSYRDRKQAVARRKKTILKVFLVVFSFQIIYSLFFSTIRIDSVSMEPSLSLGSVHIYSPFIYGFHMDLFDFRFPAVRAPERGDLIVFTPPYIKKREGFIPALGSIIRFLSFGKINLNTIVSDNWDHELLIKRVIAVPGDTVKLAQFTASIKPSDSDYFLNEFEVIDSSYDADSGSLPEGWTESLPFSGNMDPLTLEEGQYFVLGDNRAHSSDSTYWGLLDNNLIEGKILLTYWPLNKIKAFK